MQSISEEGLALIRRFEGFSAVAYRCPAGKLSIGYGHVIRAGERFDSPISEARARELLKTDVARAESAVRSRVMVPLVQEQFDALVSFVYNVGEGAFSRSALLRCINAGNHAGAAQQFRRWVYAGGQRLPGLIRRRAAEAGMYTGIGTRY